MGTGAAENKCWNTALLLTVRDLLRKSHFKTDDPPLA